MSKQQLKTDCSDCGELITFSREAPRGYCANAFCDSNRRAAVRGNAFFASDDPADQEPAFSIPPGTIAWDEHVKVWLAYADRFCVGKSNEEVNAAVVARGGFSLPEICSLLGRPPRTWRPIDEKEGAK